MTGLKNISQPQPLAKLAYERLRDSILTGALRPGEVYKEMNLAQELGISRTPVREALLSLSAQGLVTFLPRKGVMINHFDRRDVEEVFEVRGLIERGVIEKVTLMDPRPDLTRIEQTLDQQRRAIKSDDYLTFLQADRAFHNGLTRMVGNQRLIGILDNIRDLFQVMAVEALAKAGRNEEVIEEHRKVLEAVRSGDPAQAGRAMSTHLRMSMLAVLERLEEREGG